MKFPDSTGQYPPGSALMLSHGKLAAVIRPSATLSRTSDSTGGRPSILRNRESIEYLQVTVPLPGTGTGKWRVANVVELLGFQRQPDLVSVQCHGQRPGGLDVVGEQGPRGPGVVGITRLDEAFGDFHLVGDIRR